MRQASQVAAEDVVFDVVLRSLQIVPGADGLFAVVVFGFVGVEVYFSEESVISSSSCQFGFIICRDG